MRSEKIAAAWDRMNPDLAAKERMRERLQGALEGNAHKSSRVFPRFSVGFAAACVVLLGSLGTAYAASPSFRAYIHSLFFPLYTSEELVSIDQGHMTGSFDERDVLLTFLDRFNRLEFGNSVTAVKEDGYHYSLFMQDAGHLQAFVESSLDGYCIAVFMERLAYEDTEGIWQVTAYQILENSAADTMERQLEPYPSTL